MFQACLAIETAFKRCLVNFAGRQEVILLTCRDVSYIAFVYMDDYKRNPLAKFWQVMRYADQYLEEHNN